MEGIYFKRATIIRDNFWLLKVANSSVRNVKLLQYLTIFRQLTNNRNERHALELFDLNPTL